MEDRTLEELEGRERREPAYDTYPVETVRRLRRTPLKDFTVEDLRIMIALHQGLEHLVPRAVRILERNVMAEGAVPGDLLAAVLKVPQAYWESHRKLHDRVTECVERAVEHLTEVLPDEVQRLLDEFRQ